METNRWGNKTELFGYTTDKDIHTLWTDQKGDIVLSGHNGKKRKSEYNQGWIFR